MDHDWEYHRTDTVIIGNKGVQAICVVCGITLGPVHGEPDGLGNMAAMQACYDERDRHSSSLNIVVWPPTPLRS